MWVRVAGESKHQGVEASTRHHDRRASDRQGSSSHRPSNKDQPPALTHLDILEVETDDKLAKCALQRL